MFNLNSDANDDSARRGEDRSSYLSTALAQKSVFEPIFGLSRDSVAVIDSDYNLLYTNQNKDYDFETAVSTKCYYQLYGNSEVCKNCPLNKVLTENKATATTIKNDFTGEFKEISSSPIACENGETKLLLHIIRDVSSKIEQENKFKEIDSSFKTIINSAPLPTVISDLYSGKILFANNRAEKKLKLNLTEEWNGFPKLFFNQESAERFYHLVRENGEALQFETEVILKNQEKFWALISGSYIYYEGTKAVYASILDITERKEFERKIDRQKLELELVLELSPAQIWIKNLSNVVIKVNKRVCDELKLSKDKIVGRNIKDIYPEFSDNYFQFDNEILKYGKTFFNLREDITDERGKIKKLAIDKAPLIDAEGRITGIIAITKDITELESAKIERDKTESEFLLLAKILPDFILKTDLKNDILFASSKANKFFNINPEKLIGNNLSSLDIPKEIFDLIESAKTEKISKEIELSYLLNGKDKYVNYRAIIESDKNGEIVSILNYFRDNTDKRELELPLKLAEFTIENARDAVVYLDKDGAVKYANKSALKNFGYEISELLKKSYPDLDLGDDDLSWQWKFEHLKIADFISNETVCRKKNSEIFPAEITSKFISALGEERIVAIISNISERKNKEKALIDSEERFRLLFTNMIQGFILHEVVVDANGKAEDCVFLEMNEAAERITGYNKETSIGKRLKEVNPSVADFLIEAFGDAALNGKTMAFEHYSSVAQKYLQLFIYQIKFGQCAVFINDINEKKLAEDLIQNQIKELSAKNAEMERFTYTVSHDLRSPLITIKGFLGFLKEDIQDNDSSKIFKDISRIENAASKMEELLNDLLELSRIGRIINPSSKISMTELAKETIESLNAAIIEKNIEVVVQEEMPVILCDQIRIKEALQNLIENAIKFIGADNPNPTIWIGYDALKKGKGAFYVRDNGVGIEPVYHEKIFGLFEKLDSEKDGSGIGLALVKRIIEQHKGEIWVESDKNQGAHFYFNVQDIF